MRELVPAAGSAGTDPLNFAERVLQGLGARCVREGGLLRAELSPEQLAELEERPLWTLFLWQPHAGNSVLLRLRAGADAGDDDDAEPLLPGSARLEQLCRFALRRGAVARAFLAPVTAEAPLRPYLALHFRVSYVGHDVRERLDSVAVDLVDGRAFPCPSLAELPLAADGAGCETERPRLTVGEAHERAVDELCRRIAKEDPAWYHEKLRWIEAEAERLNAYLRLARTELPSAEVLAAVRDARWFELRRLSRPRVEVRAVAATVIYAPGSWPKPSAMY